MNDKSSMNKKAIIPADSNKQLSLPQEIVNRGLQLAIRIEQQQSIQTYRNPTRYFPGIGSKCLIDIAKNGRFAAIIPIGPNQPDLLIWDALSGNINTLSSRKHGYINLGQGGFIWSLALSNNGDLALVGYDDGDILGWDVKNNLVIFRIVGSWQLEPVGMLAFFPNNQWFTYKRWDSELRILEFNSSKRIGYFNNSYEPTLISFSSDGNKALVFDDYKERALTLYTVQSEQERVNTLVTCAIKSAEKVKALSIFPDNRTLITLDRDGFIKIWDSSSGDEIMHWHHGKLPSKELETLSEKQKSDSDPSELYPFRSMRSIAVSPDGKGILSGGVDKCMRLWTIDGQEICEFPHDSFITKISFLPDGKRAVSGCSDGSIYLWDLPINRPL